MAKQYTYQEDDEPMMVSEDVIAYPQGVTVSHVSWRDIAVTDKVRSMTLGPSELSMDTRSDKELLAEALEEKYK